MDLAGKIVVVTGGTSGIGQSAALMLAARGAEVVVIGRDAARGAETEAALKKASGGLGAFLKADLSVVSEARRVVGDLGIRLQKIDALIQSAGVLDFEASTTSEGLNKMFVTNFLHKLVLAEGLAPLLAKGPGRMVLVASDVADTVGLDWSNFEGARVYAGVLALPRLHGASVAVAQHLAAEWKGAGIQVTAFAPGQSATGIYRSFKGVWKCGQYVMRLFQVPVEKPAALLCWLAFSPEADGLSNNFFPSLKKHGERRVLGRDAQTVGRVMKTARDVLASA
jgi:NAD(P)-dependent dehydrogenase (short-subunit alcohol dehydrogenase family)